MVFLYLHKGVGEFSFEEAKVILFGIPFEYSQIYSFGTKYFPILIREAILSLEDEKNLISKVKLYDAGNLEIVPGNFELTAKRIEDTVKICLNHKKKFIAIGGEHTISLPIIKVIRPKTVIHFDAHADLRENYLENKYASSTWAFHASKYSKIIQLGIRTMYEEEKKNAKKLGIKQVKTLKGLKLQDPIYITIDMDVFDLSLAREVSIPEPEKGLDLEKLKKEFAYLKGKRILGADICECSATSFLEKTPFLAAKVFFYLLELLL